MKNRKMKRKFRVENKATLSLYGKGEKKGLLVKHFFSYHFFGVNEM
jgi:hypothetical protein